MEIKLPNVQGYQEFLNALKQDKRFEEYIRECSNKRSDDTDNDDPNGCTYGY